MYIYICIYTHIYTHAHTYLYFTYIYIYTMFDYMMSQTFPTAVGASSCLAHGRADDSAPAAAKSPWCQGATAVQVKPSLENPHFETTILL